MDTLVMDVVTIDVVPRVDENNQPVVHYYMEHGAPIATYKTPHGNVYGIPLGTAKLQPHDESPAGLPDRYLKVLCPKGKEGKFDTIKCGELVGPSHTGVMAVRLHESCKSNNFLLAYFPNNDPEYNLRLIKAKTMFTNREAFDGYIYSNESFTLPTGEIRYRYSCPVFMRMLAGVYYTFGYYCNTLRKKMEVSFEYRDREVKVYKIEEAPRREPMTKDGYKRYLEDKLFKGQARRH